MKQSKKATYLKGYSYYSKAFTIVELLIVIVIIAILATVTVVAFNGVQKRAESSSVAASLNQAAKKLELYNVSNSAYPLTLGDAGVSNSDVTYQFTGSSASYCVTGTKGATSLYINNTQTNPTSGACAGHIINGSAPATITDGFNRSDSATTLGTTETGQTWSVSGTLWGIRSNKAYKVGTAKTSSSAWVDYTARDMAVTATYINALQYSTLVARFSPPYATGSGYRFTSEGAVSSLARRINGANTVLYTAPSFAAGSIVKISTIEEASGTRVTLTINGAQVYTTLDSTVDRPMGTSAGFTQSTTVNEVEFDNFKVEPY